MTARRTTLSPRLALAACAAAAIVFLGLELHANRLEQETRAITRTALVAHIPPAAVQRAERDLGAAARLSADSTPTLQRAELLFYSGNAAAAEQLVGGVLREEPQNSFAWELESTFLRGRNPARSAAALARHRTLLGVRRAGRP